MTTLRISEVLRGDAAVGDTVTVQGWIRTRRDSKAGLSFLAIHDGSTLSLGGPPSEADRATPTHGWGVAFGDLKTAPWEPD